MGFIIRSIFGLMNFLLVIVAGVSVVATIYSVLKASGIDLSWLANFK